MQKRVEQLFEAVIWRTRIVVLIAVVASIVAAIVMFYMATVDTAITVSHLVRYADPALDAAARKAMHDSTLEHIVEIVDGYLLGTVLLIFGLGLYELFISKIDLAKDSESHQNVLLIRSLDDLKNRLAKVILMILVVNFFERVMKVHVGTALDLLWMAGGVALIGAAVWLSHAADAKHGD
jgi:uncharacterized membrane protein YqhA